MKRAKGLYKNGNRWWLRVRQPSSGERVPVSTGTDNLLLANKITAMVSVMRDERPMQDLLEAVAARDLSLLELYDHFATGTIATLRAQREAKLAAERDVDLAPLVREWIQSATGLRGRDVSERQRHDYARKVLALVGERLPASRWNEEDIAERLLSLTNERTGEPLTGTTLRSYVAAGMLFHKWVRKKVPGLTNPFEGDWIPKGNGPRNVFWDHDTTMEVLDRMSGEPRLFMAAIFGTGMELTAALALTGADFGRTGEQTVVAHGTKNLNREDRTIFMDAWAWGLVEPHARLVLPRASVWSEVDADAGNVREAFYEAQVAAKLVEKPPRSERSGKRLWGRVEGLHTIHDARHTYCIVRTLGLDGEPRRDAEFCAAQLGHADTQMVERIYKKANIKERLRLLQLAEARKQATVLEVAK